MAAVETQPFKLRVPPGRYSALKAISVATGRSINELINDAIHAYLLEAGPRQAEIEGHLATFEVDEPHE
jgi:hypothetical protein